MGRRHAENLAKHVEQAHLLTVFDANRDRGERVANELGAVSVESVDALVGRADVRAVVIASPARHHEEHAIAAARAGKDVFVEKPIAMTLDGADRVIAAARQAGVRLQVGFQRRFDPPYAEARKLVASGALGKPLFYRGINRDRETPLGQPGSFARGDILTDSAIHDLDGARWMLAAEVASVWADLATVGDPTTAPGPNVAMVILHFDGGAIAHIETMRGARYAYDIRSEVLCEDGAVMIGGFAQTMLTVLRGNERREDMYPGFLERYADAYAAELRAFISGVPGRRPPAVTGDDGRRALAIALAAERAAAMDGGVRLR
jgi:scyllo-inositol 2-dehydrogenase (NAD+)